MWPLLVCASEKGCFDSPAPLLPSCIVLRPLAISLLHGIIEAPIVRLRSCRTWQQPSAGRITSRTSPRRRSCPRYVTAGCASTENAHVPFRGSQTHFPLWPRAYYTPHRPPIANRSLATSRNFKVGRVPTGRLLSGLLTRRSKRCGRHTTSSIGTSEQ